MKTFKLFALIVALAFLWACSPSSNSGSGGVASPTSGPAGTATFVSNGGTVTDLTSGGSGGYGGGINFDVYGDVWVTRSGSVDTSFTVPTYASNYGANKLTISTNTTAKLNLAGTCAAGDVYLTTGNTDLSYCAVTNTPIVATGLEVQSGVILMLPGNHHSGYSARITLENAITINGTVKPATDRVDLRLRSENLLQIGRTGTITTKPTADGTDGADIHLYSGGVAINGGIIDASGSDATVADGLAINKGTINPSTPAIAVDGGAAGGVNFEADTFLYNTGTILAKGGAGTTGIGGKGRHIHLYAYAASLFNSGTIDNSGGNGGTTGGNGGYNIRLSGGDDYIGSVIVSGSVRSNGGNGGTTGGNGGGYGGYYGGIYFYNEGGKLWSNATISAKGGSSTAAAGGNGGDFDLYSAYADAYHSYEVETKGIKLSGDIDLSGGNGATGGGYGGELYFDNSYSDYGPLPSPAAQMVGFASLTMNGGAGVIGGYGGYYDITTASYEISDGDVYVPVGSIVNQVPVTAKGGAGSMIDPLGKGGHGGSIDFDSNNYYSLATTITTSNSGAINIPGGEGNVGGWGGLVYMFGYGKLTNSGAIIANGGNGTIAGGHGSTNGGDPGIMLLSSYDIENTGAINAEGGTGTTGNGAGYHGEGGGVYVYAGGQTRNSARIIAAGGAGTTSGGDGGTIDLFSEMLSTSNSGYLSALKGIGGTTAVDGWIKIDLVNVGPVI